MVYEKLGTKTAINEVLIAMSRSGNATQEAMFRAFDQLADRLKEDPESWQPEKASSWGSLSSTRPPRVREAEWAFLKMSQKFNRGEDRELLRKQNSRIEKIERILTQNTDSLEKGYYDTICVLLFQELLSVCDWNKVSL